MAHAWCFLQAINTMRTQTDNSPTIGRLAYRITEVADALGISRSKAYELVGSGEIPSILLDGCRRVTASGIHDFIARKQQGK